MARRTGKSGNAEQSPAENSAQFNSSSTHQRLKELSETTAPLLANNIAAQALVSALALMQQGYCGPKTEAILTAISVGITDPLEEWELQILAWSQPALLSSAQDSSG